MSEHVEFFSTLPAIACQLKQSDEIHKCKHETEPTICDIIGFINHKRMVY